MRRKRRLSEEVQCLLIVGLGAGRLQSQVQRAGWIRREQRAGANDVLARLRRVLLLRRLVLRAQGPDRQRYRRDRQHRGGAGDGPETARGGALPTRLLFLSRELIREPLLLL